MEGRECFGMFWAICQYIPENDALKPKTNKQNVKSPKICLFIELVAVLNHFSFSQYLRWLGDERNHQGVSLLVVASVFKVLK